MHSRGAESKTVLRLALGMLNQRRRFALPFDLRLRNVFGTGKKCYPCSRTKVLPMFSAGRLRSMRATVKDRLPPQTTTSFSSQSAPNVICAGSGGWIAA
jgi:hypothetical protein